MHRHVYSDSNMVDISHSLSVLYHCGRDLTSSLVVGSSLGVASDIIILDKKRDNLCPWSLVPSFYFQSPKLLGVVVLSSYNELVNVFPYFIGPLILFIPV